MTTKESKGWRCSFLSLSLMVPLFLIALTSIIRSQIAIDGARNPSLDSSYVEVFPDRAVVKDCYRLTKKERYQAAIEINRSWKEMGIAHQRSIQSIESEINLHRIAYYLNVRTDQAKDADIDLADDSRFIVRASYKALMIFDE